MIIHLTEGGPPSSNPDMRAIHPGIGSGNDFEELPSDFIEDAFLVEKRAIDSPHKNLGIASDEYVSDSTPPYGIARDYARDEGEIIVRGNWSVDGVVTRNKR